MIATANAFRPSTAPMVAPVSRRQRIRERDHHTGVDAHQAGRVAVIGGGHEGLAVDGLAIEDFDQDHHAQRAEYNQQLHGQHVGAQHLDRRRAQRGGKAQVVAAPDVFGHVLEDDPQGDGGHDPAEFRPRLDGRPHADPFDECALRKAEYADDGDHDPVVHAQADQRQPDQRAQHQGFALAEVQGARGGESKLVSERDDGIDHA
ncbi:hypothetical protein G6F57_018401 [Rhizopus arrhizus]|nr:hypothetical protein G6F57_018401 [Rhizopus arrhizus]